MTVYIILAVVNILAVGMCFGKIMLKLLNKFFQQGEDRKTDGGSKPADHVRTTQVGAGAQVTN
jgi:hypothetical protein